VDRAVAKRATRARHAKAVGKGLRPGRRRRVPPQLVRAPPLAAGERQAQRAEPAGRAPVGLAADEVVNPAPVARAPVEVAAASGQAEVAAEKAPGKISLLLSE
jgi:hypothetical protein